MLRCTSNSALCRACRRPTTIIKDRLTSAALLAPPIEGLGLCSASCHGSFNASPSTQNGQFVPKRHFNSSNRGRKSAMGGIFGQTGLTEAAKDGQTEPNVDLSDLPPPLISFEGQSDDLRDLCCFFVVLNHCPCQRSALRIKCSIA
jgi:hypothetical protein